MKHIQGKDQLRLSSGTVTAYPSGAHEFAHGEACVYTCDIVYFLLLVYVFTFLITSICFHILNSVL